MYWFKGQFRGENQSIDDKHVNTSISLAVEGKAQTSDTLLEECGHPVTQLGWLEAPELWVKLDKGNHNISRYVMIVCVYNIV